MTTRREVIAAWLAERENFHTVNQATQMGFLSDADDLLERLDACPLWTVQQIADYTGLAGSTISGYQARTQIPEPTCHHGRVRLWEPDVIRKWRPR